MSAIVTKMNGQKKKNPRKHCLRGFKIIKAGSVLLSHGNSHTIIGAERFHFRVRNGIGWFPLAMAASQTFTLTGCIHSAPVCEYN